MPVSPPGSPVSLSDEACCWSHTDHRSRYGLPRSHKIPSSPSDKKQTGPPQKRKMPHMDSLPPDQRQIPPANTFSPTQMNHSHNKDKTPSSPFFPVLSMPRTIILSVLPFRFRHCLRLRLLFPLFIFSFYRYFVLFLPQILSSDRSAIYTLHFLPSHVQLIYLTTRISLQFWSAIPCTEYPHF